MDLSQIKMLIEAMAATDLAEMSCSHAGWTLKLQRFSRAGQAPAAEAAATAAEPVSEPARVADRAVDLPASPPTDESLLVAPMYGVVHLQPAQDAVPFVRVGDTVQAGQTLCVIEAMKVFNTVCAEATGVVEAVLVASGEEVEAGQVLMRLACC